MRDRPESEDQWAWVREWVGLLPLLAALIVGGACLLGFVAIILGIA